MNDNLQLHIYNHDYRETGLFYSFFPPNGCNIPMDFIVIIYSMLYRSTSLFLINVHTLCHLIISDWKNTIVLLM